ncbi:MAG: hypothetical protein GWP06_12470 [Actinobacteria bacterium]|nr:hypothetical protein [Actinomycetota bacterium]
MNRKVYILLFLFLASCLTFVYAYLYETHHVEIETVELTSTKFSQSFSGLDIVHISDLHLKKLSGYEAHVVRRINALQPDIIVITGDFFHSAKILEHPQKSEFKSALKNISIFVSSLRAKKGVYIVRGNNDFSNDKEASNIFVERMRALGVNVLANSKTVLRQGNEKIAFLGVDYPEFSKEERADFYVNEIGGEKFLQSNASKKNSYSHFFANKNETFWQNYIYSGKMCLTNAKQGAIGITFYSQFNNGLDKFYRLRRTASRPSFHFSPHGTRLRSDHLDTGVIPEENIWYYFKIQIATNSAGVRMRAKVWQESKPGPAEWQATAFDDSPSRLQSGTVGVWSAKEGKHRFDDLTVVSTNNDTLLNEKFATTQKGHDPANWVDYNYSYEAIPVLMRDVPDSCYSILLAHSPDYVKFADPCHVDLVLSGHTHGGQIRLPFIGPLVVRIALGRKYAQGLHRFGDTNLYVTRGIGTALVPVRFLCPPEITLIKLRSRKK